MSPCEGVERARGVMGTIARAVVCGPADPQAVIAAREALDAIERVDEVMSLYRPDSDLSRLNREGHPGPVAVDPELIDLLERSGTLWTATNGRFDVTVKPLMDHYGFYREIGFPALPGGLRGALSRVGFEALEIDPGAGEVSFGREGMGVDLGGIAKGYALDRAAEAMRRRGVRSGFIDLGRNLMFVGAAPSGTGRWIVAIEDPVMAGTVARCIEVPPGAVSTSSVSGRTARGGAVGHVLDPRRGWRRGKVLQATVWSPSATRADALSTALLLSPTRRSRGMLDDVESAVRFRRSRIRDAGYRIETIGEVIAVPCGS